MALTEKQSKSFEGKKLKTVYHMNMEDGGVLVQRCESLEVSRIVRTPKTKGRWGRGVVTWALDGVDEEFDTVEQLASVMEKLGKI